MTVQAYFDKELFSKLPRVSKLVSELKQLNKDFEANQVINRTLREALSTPISVNDKTYNEIYIFERDLFDIFKNNQWI